MGKPQCLTVIAPIPAYSPLNDAPALQDKFALDSIHEEGVGCGFGASTMLKISPATLNFVPFGEFNSACGRGLQEALL